MIENFTREEEQVIRDLAAALEKSKDGKHLTPKQVKAVSMIRGIPLTFDSMRLLSITTGIPESVLRDAKRNKCPAFIDKQRVKLLDFLRWHFKREQSTEDTTDYVRLRQREEFLNEQTKRLKNQEKFVLKSDVEDSALSIMGVMFAELDRIFASDFPREVEGLDKAEIREKAESKIERLKERLREMFEQMKETGKAQ